ncbi:L,D-transpeptidase [Methylacidimicrobium sp. B4]|nr:L,D-transpeptidase [Methylacidimicrobium sp. B4]
MSLYPGGKTTPLLRRERLVAAALLLIPGCLLVLLGCASGGRSTMGGGSGRTAWGSVPPGPVPASRVVKVSLQSQAVYVLDGDRIIWAAATNVGKPGHPTPTGTYRVSQKLERKRSGSYGFWVNGSRVIPTEGGGSPGSGWRYVGYPMPYWVEFLPGYGFHEGYVWAQPHTHGCLRLHGSTAGEFYRLVEVGTPVQIRASQPEDQTIGPQIPRFDDSRAPDPPNAFLISDAVFSRPWN